MPHADHRRTVAIATAAILGSISAIHVLWGRGSTFPFRDRRTLNDHVVGRQVTPSPTECNAVACLLAVAAVSVDRAARRPSAVSRIVAAGCGAVLAVRAVLGFTGLTHVAVPGSTSANFRRNDRRVFAPVCALIALGSLGASV